MQLLSECPREQGLLETTRKLGLNNTSIRRFALFKSRSITKTKTELVVVVTPEMAEPAAGAVWDLPMPIPFLPPVLQEQRAKPAPAGTKRGAAERRCGTGGAPSGSGCQPGGAEPAREPGGAGK